MLLLINKINVLLNYHNTLLFIEPGQTEVFLIAALIQQGRKELTHRINSQGRLRRAIPTPLDTNCLVG